jgi:5-methylthioadenosine/S-adenosylhomocysteine deaminase
MALLFKNATVLTGDPVQMSTCDVLVDGEIIVEVGTQIESNHHPETTLIDCSEALLTPGFINGHIHLNQLLNRGFLDDLATENLLSNMHSRHEAKSDEDRYWASLVSIHEALLCGTTFFGAFATSRGLIAQAMHDAGVRGYLTIGKKDQWWGSGTAEQAKTGKILQTLEKEIEQWCFPHIALSLGVASDRAATEELLRGVRHLADQSGLRIALHVSEGQASVDLSIEHRGARPVEYLRNIGFLGSDVTLIHACNVSDEEIDLISQARASICHCPVSNARTMAGTMPLRKIARHGVPTCLGTDAASTGNTNNILVEAYFAALLHRVVGQDASYPSATDLFRFLTIEGARAVGLEDEIGQVRPGFKADLTLWNLNQSGFLPNVSTPLNSLIYCPTDVRASQVYVGGRLIFSGNPLTFDSNLAMSHIANYAKALAMK